MTEPASVDRYDPFTMQVDHIKLFADFVNELWATMVDPVDNPPSLAAAMPVIVEAARKQRDQLNTPLTDLAIEVEARATKTTDVVGHYYAGAFILGAKWAREKMR